MYYFQTSEIDEVLSEVDKFDINKANVSII